MNAIHHNFYQLQTWKFDGFRNGIPSVRFQHFITECRQRTAQQALKPLNHFNQQKFLIVRNHSIFSFICHDSQRRLYCSCKQTSNNNKRTRKRVHYSCTCAMFLVFIAPRGWNFSNPCLFQCFLPPGKKQAVRSLSCPKNNCPVHESLWGARWLVEYWLLTGRRRMVKGLAKTGAGFSQKCCYEKQWKFNISISIIYYSLHSSVTTKTVWAKNCAFLRFTKFRKPMSEKPMAYKLKNSQCVPTVELAFLRFTKFIILM